MGDGFGNGKGGKGKMANTLARLPIKSSRASNHYYDASLSVCSFWLASRHVWQDLADQVDGSSYVDVHNEVEIVE